MTHPTLKWRQVNAWRLRQHGLSPRLERQDFIKAVKRTGGIQAQVMSAANLGLWARVEGLSPADVHSALWTNHTLVKTWAMRGTLHLIAASELPLYAAARSVYDNRNWTAYFDYYGVSPAQFDTFIAAVPQILGSEPMTREQLASALDRHTGIPALGKLILSSSWGSPLKPSAWRGDLCLGPNQGAHATYVNPRTWIGGWETIEPYPALQEVARRYLWAYGPASPEAFALWWGASGITLARKLFRSIEDELEQVDVEGWRGWVLRTTLEPMQSLEPSGSVNLLPLFDAYVLGLGRGLELEPHLPRAYHGQVFRPQGWISAVVLVDGEIKGVWEYKAQRSAAVVRVRLFSPAAPMILWRIEAEAERLSAYLNSKVILEIEDA